MKLLRNQVETVTEDNVTVGVKVIDTVTQARLIDYSQRPGVEGFARYMQVLFRDCLDNVIVDGEEFDPRDLAAHADLSDDATFKTIKKIDALAVKVLFLQDDEAKKSA